jgi:hypothetical protein
VNEPMGKWPDCSTKIDADGRIWISGGSESQLTYNRFEPKGTEWRFILPFETVEMSLTLPHFKPLNN